MSAILCLASSPVEPFVADFLRIALAQINPKVGDLIGNRDKILAQLAVARDQGAHLVVFPELAACGYPPRDLLHKPAFLLRLQRCQQEVAAACHGIVAVVGGVAVGGELYNAAFVCAGGQVVAVQRKTCLPNYDVFDERRYFHAAGPGDNALFDARRRRQTGRCPPVRRRASRGVDL